MRRSGKELKVDPESGRFEGVHEFKETPELLEERKRAYVEQLQDELTLYKEKLRRIQEWANDSDWPVDEGEWQEPAYYHGIGHAQAHIVEILGGEE